MIKDFLRYIRTFVAFAALVPKLYVVFRFWVWMNFLGRILSLAVFTCFWRAVYAENAVLSGMTLDTTLNYILLAQVLGGIVQSGLPLVVGSLVREGYVGIELLRPADFQFRWYAHDLSAQAINLLVQIPLLIVACWFFGLRLPDDPYIWAAFAVSLFLGHAVIFCFDWIFTCLVFYTTEVWGLWVFREGIAAFCGGALLPLAFMPHWLERGVHVLPFAQALYVPVSILSGITPVANAPSLLLTQILWLIALGVLSRIIFSIAVRKITVQGG